MPDDLLYQDAYAWSLIQADRLRRLRAGERVNDLDWDNIIEEIESVGRSEATAVESLLIQAVLHLMKIRAWPAHPAARKWRVDAAEFLLQAQERYRPSMAQIVDLSRVLHYAEKRLPLQRFTTPAQPLPPIRHIPLSVPAEDTPLDFLEAALFPPA